MVNQLAGERAKVRMGKFTFICTFFTVHFIPNYVYYTKLRFLRENGKNLGNIRKNEDILRYAKKNKSAHGLPRQQCAFSKESSKFNGCGNLKRYFYTRFIPIFKDFGL